MAHKFNIVIEVRNNKPVSQVFLREEAHKAKDEFSTLRSQGKEAYLFLCPTEDKSCKSVEQNAASLTKEQVKSVAADILSTAKTLVAPKKKKEVVDEKPDLTI